MKEIKIAFLGCGNMGRSLIGGLIANGYPEHLLCGADPDAAQRKQLSELFNIPLTASNQDAAKDAEVLVLAVKPQMIQQTIADIQGCFDSQKGLVLSIAAGVRLATINQALGGGAVVRVMPNTPALIQAGAAALFANELVSDEQKELAEAIMRSVGITVWLDKEDKMDAVTALSGSGPAYFFLQMEAMENAAVRLGLDEQQARLLTLETAFGAAKMAMESSHDPAVLRKQVTSPGGTTEKALESLMQGGYLGLFEEALQAASDRSRELADSFSGDSGQ